MSIWCLGYEFFGFLQIHVSDFLVFFFQNFAWGVWCHEPREGKFFRLRAKEWTDHYGALKSENLEDWIFLAKPSCRENVGIYPPWKLTVSHLKMDGVGIRSFLWGKLYFQGGAVSFREGLFLTLWYMRKKKGKNHTSLLLVFKKETQYIFVPYFCSSVAKLPMKNSLVGEVI